MVAVGTGQTALTTPGTARGEIDAQTGAGWPLGMPGGTPPHGAPSHGEPPRIRVDGLVHSYALGRDSVRALDGISLLVAPGEFVSLVGPSGCGKSTLLRIVAGLDDPVGGQVEISATPLASRLGACGYMPQRDMLLPWRTVLDNAALPLEYQGLRRREARRKASTLLALLGLDAFAGARPAALSGGMRQRVALARTVLTGRRALLLDEPFGALDALTRLEVQQWLLDVWERLGATVLLVTHDLDEAIYLSDRIYVMSARPGRIVAELAVGLPRPRREDVMAAPEFGALKGRLLAAIHATGKAEAQP